MKNSFLRWVSALLAAAMLMQSTGGLVALAEEAATPETAESSAPPATVESSATPETARTEEEMDSAAVPALLSLRENADGVVPPSSPLDGVSVVTENPLAPVLGMEDIYELVDEMVTVMYQETGVDSETLTDFVNLADDQAEAVYSLLNSPAPVALTDEGNVEQPQLPLPLIANDESKIQVLSPAVAAYSNENAVAAEGTVLVVEDNCMVVQVQKNDGTPLNGALVTVKNKSTGQTTSHYTQVVGTTGGIAIIPDIEESTYCLMDVQAKGYQTHTYLDMKLEGKSQVTVQLEPINPAEPFYIRTADLSGADLMRGDTSIDLVAKAEDSAESTLTIMLARNPGDKTPWPEANEKLMLVAQGDKKQSESPLGDDNLRVVSVAGHGLQKTGSSESDLYGDTLIYTQTERWNQRKDNLLRGGDVLSIRYGYVSQELLVNQPVLATLNRVTVRNALIDKPVKVHFPFSIGNAAGNGTSSVSSVTIKNTGTFLDDVSVSTSMPKLPATLMMLPNGTYFLGVSMGTKLGDSLNKAESFGEKPINPCQQAKAEGFFDELNQMWNKKIEELRSADARIMDTGSTGLHPLTTSGYSCTLYGMLGVIGGYNYDEGRLEGAVSGAIKLTGKFSQTFYWIIGVVPVHLGYELSAGGGLDLTVGVSSKVPSGYESVEGFENLFSQLNILSKVQDKSTLGSIGMSLNLGVGLYAGLGVKGVAAVQAEGNGALGYTHTLLAADRDPSHTYPHKVLKLTLTGGFRVTMLFFNATKMWIYKKTLYDSWDKTYLAYALAAAPPPESGMVSLNLSAASEAPEDAGLYTADAGPVLLADNASGNVATSVLSDNLLQIVHTNGAAAVFRLASMDGRPRLVWQSMDPESGNVDPTVHVLETEDVFSYAVAANTTQNTDAASQDNVYITLITGDFDKGDTPEQRAATTGVRGITLNLKTGDILFDQQVREPDGTYCHSPQAAGVGNLCNPMWIESKTFTAKANTGTLRRWNGDEAGITRIGTIKNSMLSTGLVGAGQPCLLRVSWSGSGLRLRAYDSNGKGVQGMECMLPIDTATLSESESQNLLEHVYVSGNCLYLVSAGRLVRVVMDTDASGAPTMTASTAKNSDGSELHIASGQGSYDLSVLPGQSNHSGNLVTVVSRTDENGKLANIVKNQFFYDLDSQPFVIYPAQEYELPDTSALGEFAVLAHPGDSLNCLDGLSLVYNANIREDPTGSVYICDVRQWHKDLGEELTAEAVYLPMAVVKRGQTDLELQVKITNTGGKTEDQVWLKAWDEHGDPIHLNNESEQYGTVAYGLSPALAPGESQWLTVSKFTALTCWQNGAHTIHVQASHNGNFLKARANDVSVPTGSAQLTMAQSLLTLSGDLYSYGNRKLVNLTITNESMVDVPFNTIKLMQIAYDGDGEVDPDEENATIALDFSGLGDTSLTDCKLINNQWTEHGYNVTLDVTKAMEGHRYLLLYLTTDKNGGTDSVTAYRTLMLENPDIDDAYQHIGTEVARPLTGTTAGDKGLTQWAATDLTATAADGFRFAGWQDESGVIVSTDNPLHIQCTDCAEDHRTFTAVFEDAGSHLLTLNADPAQGTVQVEGVSDTQTISDGTVYTAPDDAALTLSVTPAAGKRFVGWQENGAIVSADAPLTLTLTASRTLTAVFEDVTAAQTSDSRVQAQSGLRDDDLPEGMTVQQAQTALHDALAGRLALEGSALYSVQLQIRQNNGQWQPVDGELAEPVTVTLTLPEGVNARQQTIVVAHMRTIDSMEGDAGSIEFPAVTVISEREVQVTVSSLSPFAAGWSAAPRSEHPEIGEAIRNGTWGVDDTPTAKATGAIPRTSDDSPLLLWVALLGISLAGLVLLVIRKRRRK